MHGQPLVGVTEQEPLAPHSPALYSATKARAEQVVLAGSRDGLETVVVRPRLVWGAGDTTILAGPDRLRALRAVPLGRRRAPPDIDDTR